MKIKEKIYGVITINLPVIIELLNSPLFQRLKKIAQFGIPDEFYHKKNYSRFEHSVGVMALLKKLGATEEEQIAGLLHDVSHTAFSHVIDWVVGKGRTENYQDREHNKFVRQSEIPTILKKYGYNFNELANYKKFKLLERKIPNLCADRIDYALREFPKPLARYCFAGLTVRNGKIVFQDKKTAKVFAENFLRLQEGHWGGFEATSRYRLFGDLLREALNKKIIKFIDFWKNDGFVLNKLKKSRDHLIQRYLRLLRKKSLEALPKSTVIVYKKFRYVDPEFVLKNKVVRLSKVDIEFRKEIEQAKTKNKKGVFVPSAV
jgi:hypothetical protein